MNSESLEVRLAGEKVGELVRTKNGARFMFSEEVASTHPFSPLLSTALCVQERPFDESYNCPDAESKHFEINQSLYKQRIHLQQYKETTFPSSFFILLVTIVIIII